MADTFSDMAAHSPEPVLSGTHSTCPHSAHFVVLFWFFFLFLFPDPYVLFCVFECRNWRWLAAAISKLHSLMWTVSVMLRVRAFFHKTVRVCHVYCNFKIGFTCRITAIFGTLKDGSLLINTLASNICFSYRNMFQNGVDALSKIVDTFLSKSSKFHLVRIIW